MIDHVYLCRKTVVPFADIGLRDSSASSFSFVLHDEILTMHCMYE